MRAPEPQHREMYEFLMRSEGWALLSEWLTASAQDAMERAIASSDAYATARALGMLAAYRLVLARPGLIVASLKTLQQE